MKLIKIFVSYIESSKKMLKVSVRASVPRGNELIYSIEK